MNFGLMQYFYGVWGEEGGVTSKQTGCDLNPEEVLNRRTSVDQSNFDSTEWLSMLRVRRLCFLYFTGNDEPSTNIAVLCLPCRSGKQCT